jgi:hypothetical protein
VPSAGDRVAGVNGATGRPTRCALWGTHARGNVFIAWAFHPTIQILAAHQYAMVDPDRRNLTVREQFVGAAVSDTQ